MTIEIKSVSQINGTMWAPPSKAHTLRAIIIASLAEGASLIRRPLIAEDQLYAIAAMRQLGAIIEWDETNALLRITGFNGAPRLPRQAIFIGNSGVSMRLLVPIAALCHTPGEVVIDGDERMRSGRPISDLLVALKAVGVEADSLGATGCPPISVKTGGFLGGETNLAGDKSSQYFSALLVAAPYAQKDVAIKTIGKLSSRPYVDITVAMMAYFGVRAENDNYQKFCVAAGQKYTGCELTVEGDYSNAAYFLGACAICGGQLAIEGLCAESKQGDKYFVALLERMGCIVRWSAQGVEILSNGKLRALGVIEMNDYPDIVMPLAVVAAFADGLTKLDNIAHLRFKESDRLEATVNELTKLGINAACDDHSLTIIGEGQAKYHGALIDSHKDHRIAMSLAMAGLKIPGISISGENAVNKSYPLFFHDLNSL